MATLAAIALALSACGGESAPADQTTQTSAGGAEASSPSSSTPAETPTPGVMFDDPAVMKDEALGVLPYLECQPDADTAEYDIHGGLGVSCIGRQGETVSFDTFKDNATLIEALTAYEEINPSSTYFAGENWAIGAQNPRTLEDLQRVLDPANAPKVKPMTKGEAAAEYRRMVEPFNESLGDFEFIDPEYSDVSEYQQACMNSQLALQQFKAELDFAAWPANAKAPAKKLSESLDGDITAYGNCIDATTNQAAEEALNFDGDQAPANALRSVLGLKNAQ